MSFHNRTYATILSTDLVNVDFEQVMETNSNTIRKSVDNSEFLIKFETDHEPTFITDGSIVPTWIGTHEECLELMASAEWSEPINV